MFWIPNPFSPLTLIFLLKRNEHREVFSVHISGKPVTDLLRNKDWLPLTADQSLQEPYFTGFRWILRMFERKTSRLNVFNGYSLFNCKVRTSRTINIYNVIREHGLIKV